VFTNVVCNNTVFTNVRNYRLLTGQTKLLSQFWCDKLTFTSIINDFSDSNTHQHGQYWCDNSR